MTQKQQVIEALLNNGGFATLRRLNEIVDFSSWDTKTPEASVRRIVQKSKEIFKIKPGLWALEDMRDEVLQKFSLKIGDKKSEEQFNHGYYQGLLVEIGKFRKQTTYVPAQDRNRLFLGRSLGTIADTTKLPQFTYEELLRRAKTVDVIWFNERKMPSRFFEVEHTTDIKNSFQNPIRQNYRHICAISENLGIPVKYIRGVIAFTGDCEFKTPMPEGVVYSKKLASYIKSFAMPLLKDREVEDIIGALQEWDASVTQEQRESHIENLKKSHQ